MQCFIETTLRRGLLSTMEAPAAGRPAARFDPKAVLQAWLAIRQWRVGTSPIGLPKEFLAAGTGQRPHS